MSFDDHDNLFRHPDDSAFDLDSSESDDRSFPSDGSLRVPTGPVLQSDQIDEADLADLTASDDETDAIVDDLLDDAPRRFSDDHEDHENDDESDHGGDESASQDDETRRMVPQMPRRTTTPGWNTTAPRTTRDRTADPELAERERADLERWLAYKANPTDAGRDEIIERYHHLVRPIAEKMSGKLHASVSVDELYSAGVTGLLGAIRGFDPTKGVKFETYCTPRVQGAMLDDLRSMDFVTRSARFHQSRYDWAVNSLESELGRPPSDFELMEFLQLDPEEFQEFVRKAQAPVMTSLSQSAGNGEEEERGLSKLDMISSSLSMDPTDRLGKREIVRRLLGQLDEKERLVLALYYFEGMKMKHIGGVLGISESRVSQIRKGMLERLPELMRDQGLDDTVSLAG